MQEKHTQTQRRNLVELHVQNIRAVQMDDVFLLSDFSIAALRFPKHSPQTDIVQSVLLDSHRQ